MFPMTPEDLYRQVARSQDEARKQAALERMAMAAPGPRGTQRWAVRIAANSAVHTLSHNARMAARHLLGANALRHGVAHRR